jgi:hypothetical protein
VIYNEPQGGECSGKFIADRAISPEERFDVYGASQVSARLIDVWRDFDCSRAAFMRRSFFSNSIRMNPIRALDSCRWAIVPVAGSATGPFRPVIEFQNIFLEDGAR